MNYLNCKKCYMAVACDEEAVAITCSICSMVDVNTGPVVELEEAA